MLEIFYENNFMFMLEIASIGLGIISYILIIIQSSNNYMFKNYKTRSLVAERLLYEQFSYEIYESILSYPYTSHNSNPFFQANYEEYNGYMNVEVKLDSFYDCRDVYDQELNEEICQNQIVENGTCCKSECCSKTNGDKTFCYNYAFNLEDNVEKINNNRILYYNYEEYLDDPKRRFCLFYSVYSKDKLIGLDYNLDYNTFLFKCRYNYIKIFLNEVSNMCIGKDSCYRDPNINIDCGIIDTMGNHLYTDNVDSCPINYLNVDNSYIYLYNNGGNYKNPNKIIIRNILSEEKPDVHEWKEKFISLEYYGNKTSEEYKNLQKKILNTRNKDFENIIKHYSSFYTETEFPMNDNDFSNLNPKAKPKLYYTNYIGFEGEKDLRTFLDNFNEFDPQNNPLYRIGRKVYPSLESIICGSVLITLCIIYLILFLCKLIEKYLWLIIVKESVLGATFIIELVIYIWQLSIFKKINIEMDTNFKEILDLYNKRRMQYLLLFGLILLFVSITPLLGFLLFKLFQLLKLKCQKKPIQQESLVIPNSPQNDRDLQTIEQNIRISENAQLNNDQNNMNPSNGVVLHNNRN